MSNLFLFLIKKRSKSLLLYIYKCMFCSKELERFLSSNQTANFLFDSLQSIIKYEKKLVFLNGYTLA